MDDASDQAGRTGAPIAAETAKPMRPAAPGVGWLTRERAQLLVLVAATLVALYLCYLIARPFLPAIAWATALAVIAYPLHRVMCRWVPQSTASAVLTLAVIIVLIIGPVVLVTERLVREAMAGFQMLQDESVTGRWRSAVERYPQLAPGADWVAGQIDIPGVAKRAGEMLQSRAGSLLTGSVWFVMELLVTVFTLFYFFRDRPEAERVVRSLLPLSEAEVDDVFDRVNGTIRATVYGSLVVAAVQGALGGLMFWFLGLPSPLVWGVVMALLAVIPSLGTFMVWGPAALFLVLEGNWGKALILTAWGATAIALIDNLLYPVLVGGKLRLHPLPVFFSILGGLVLFGAAGIILGPVTLAVAVALLDIWRRRTAHGRPAEAPVSAVPEMRTPLVPETPAR